MARRVRDVGRVDEEVHEVVIHALCLAGIYSEEGNEGLARLAGAALSVNIAAREQPTNGINSRA